MATPLLWRDAQLQNTSLNPNAALGVASGAAAALSKNIADRKRLALAQEKLLSDEAFRNKQLASNEAHRNRLQDWTEGAQQREMDLTSRRAKDAQKLLSGFEDEARINIVDVNPEELVALKNQELAGGPLFRESGPSQGNRVVSPQDTSGRFRLEDYDQLMSDSRNLVNQANAETRANPSLFVDPNTMKRQVTQQMREKGYKDENISPLLGSYFAEHFPTADPALAQEVIKGINAEKTAAELFGDKFVADAKSGNFGSGSGGSNSEMHKDFTSVDNYLEARKFKKGSEGFFDNWFDEDVYEDDIRTYTTRMANLKVPPPVALSLLDGMIKDKELSQDQFLSDENFGKLAAAAQIRMGGMGSGQTGNPADLIKLFNMGQEDKKNRIGQALASTQMRQVTPEQRRASVFGNEAVQLGRRDQPSDPVVDISNDQGSIDSGVDQLLGVQPEEVTQPGKLSAVNQRIEDVKAEKAADRAEQIANLQEFARQYAQEGDTQAEQQTLDKIEELKNFGNTPKEKVADKPVLESGSFFKNLGNKSDSVFSPRVLRELQQKPTSALKQMLKTNKYTPEVLAELKEIIKSRESQKSSGNRLFGEPQ